MARLKFGSLFSGVGGFDVGLERAGMECAWQVEIDPWANWVLTRHWSATRRTADITFTEGWQLGHVDLIAFGSPCQDLSVAGQRKGMDGERSGLFFDAIKIIRECRPTWVIWENVPGALSSARGRDFGAVLDALADAGALDICWRVLDAQWFGVPQRRRRLFVVADFGGHRAEQVLFEPAGGAGDSPTRRAAGADVAYSLTASTRKTGDGHGNAWNTTYVTRTNQTGSQGDNLWEDLSPTQGSDSGDIAIARCVTARGDRFDADTDTLLVAPFDERNVTSPGNRSRVDYGSPSPTLHAEPLSVIVAGTVRASEGHHGHSSPRGDASDNLVTVQAFAWQVGGSNRIDIARAGDYAGSLSGSQVEAVQGAFGVRRLTPRECERLMGWPDDHTRWTADGREIKDTHRYRLIGNGVVSNVAEWIGRRLLEAA